MVHDKGQLALKHPHPDAVDDCDFIFFRDDDLGVEGFDPRRFTRIMRTNRLTMAPAFTREAWRAPLGRKGIIDIMPVVHTRPVQSINAASEAEIHRILERQGLFRHPAAEIRSRHVWP